jgi:hypothetical protein
VHAADHAIAGMGPLLGHLMAPEGYGVTVQRHGYVLLTNVTGVADGGYL